MFGSAEAQIAAVKSFRRKLWCIESEGNDAENQPRNKAKRLRRMLRSWSRKDIATGAIEIEYKVDMIVTCKSFCRRASGFTKNLFDSTVLAVLNPEESNTGVYLIERRERIKDAVEFLHNFFREPVNAGKSMHKKAFMIKTHLNFQNRILHNAVNLKHLKSGCIFTTKITFRTAAELKLSLCLIPVLSKLAKYIAPIM
jgi:hypothetical protein